MRAKRLGIERWCGQYGGMRLGAYMFFCMVSSIVEPIVMTY